MSGAGAQRRPLALLALLAAAGDRGISRAKALALLWPDSDDEKARRVLSQTLYSLRRDLGHDDIAAGTSELRLNRELIAADVMEFAAAVERGDWRSAAAVYAGPFLDGFHLPGAPEFERWAEETRSGLAHRHVVLLERLADEAARAGATADELSWCRRLAAAEPLSARHAMRLMRALSRAGDRAGALQHARVYEVLLRSELDADPDPELVRLAEQLRSHPEEGAPGGGSSGRGSLGRGSGGLPPVAPSRGSTSAPSTAFQRGADPPSRNSLETEGVGATQEWMVRLAARGSRPGAESAPAAVTEDGAPLAAGSRRQAAVPRWLAAPRWWLGLAAAAVVALGGAWLALRPRSEVVPVKPVIAIATVGTIGNDTSIVWLAQGLPELVASRLFRSEEVDVSPPVQLQEVMARSGLEPGAQPSLEMLRDAARRVGATMVASARLGRQGGEYVLHLSSFDVATGKPLRMSDIRESDPLALAASAAMQLMEAAGQSGSGPAVADVETSNVEAYRAFLRARQAGDEGRRDEYVRHLDAAIALDSGFLAAVQERLALAARANDDTTVKRLTPLLTRYAARATEWDRMVQAMALAQYDGQHARAEAIGERLVARYPRDTRAYSALHEQYMHHGKFRDAARVALAALAIDSSGMEAGRGPCAPCTGYRALTDARVAMDDLDGAGAAARRWIALQPDLPAAWLNLARLELVRQRFDSALSLLRRAEVLNGGGDEYWDVRVRTLIMARRYSDADTAIANSLHTTRRWVALDARALLERERGQIRASIRTIDEAVEESPSMVWLVLMKADGLARLGAVEEGVRQIERITHPGDEATVFPLLGGTARGFAWAHALEADLLAASGDTVRMRVLADSIEVGGSRSYYGRDWRLPHHVRGLIALRGGRYDEAIAELRQALWTQSSWTRTNVELARAYLLNGRPRDALDILRPAYATPLDAMARYVMRSELDLWMSRAYAAAGMSDSARVYLARVRESWRDADPEMKARIGGLALADAR